MSKECPDCGPVINLRDVPRDVYDLIIELQAEMIKSKRRHVSLSKALYKGLRDLKLVREQNKFLLHSTSHEKKPAQGHSDRPA